MATKWDQLCWSDRLDQEPFRNLLERQFSSSIGQKPEKRDTELYVNILHLYEINFLEDGFPT